MLTTIHSGKMVNSGKVDHKTKQLIYKLDAVKGHNKNMRLFHKFDMQIATIESTRKPNKWYKKLFLYLMDITILNSYIRYNHVTNINVTVRDFSLFDSSQILQHEKIVSRHPGRMSSRDAVPNRLQASNYITQH